MAMTVHCATCNHQWTLPWKLPMSIGRIVTAMKGAVAAGCPKCGAHGKAVMVGPAPRPRPKGHPEGGRGI